MMESVLVLAALLLGLTGPAGSAGSAPATPTTPVTTPVAPSAAPSPAVVPAAVPAMAISVSDGLTSATAGDELTYTISLRNDGAAASGALDVRFEPPSGVEMTAVDHDGTRDNGVAAWAIDVPAGGTMTLTVVTRVGTPAAEANGLAGIACIVRDGTPSLCATDMNQIPGRSDINAVVNPASAGPEPVRNVAWLAGAGALAVAVLFGAGGLLVVRRRRHRRAGAAS